MAQVAGVVSRVVDDVERTRNLARKVGLVVVEEGGRVVVGIVEYPLWVWIAAGVLFAVNIVELIVGLFDFWTAKPERGASAC
jgi:hypothetical protein